MSVNKVHSDGTLERVAGLGVGIKSVDVDDGHLIVTYDDNTTHDAGEVGGGGSGEGKKCVITIVDDDGTNCTDDHHTGILSFLNERNIPLVLAVPSEKPGSSGGYTLAQLHDLESAGNEVIMHGVGSDDSVRRMTQAEFETMTDSMIAWATENGFANDLFAYPGGAWPNNDDYGLDPKIAYLKSKGVKLAYALNMPIEANLTTDYEDWYYYANGHDHFGVTNKTPFVTMPNGFSKALLANRQELKRTVLTANWWKTRMHTAIQNKAYITFITHSFASEWSTPGDDGKTTAQLFKEYIQELIDTYGDQIEWKTASGALDYIDNLNVTKKDVDEMIDAATRGSKMTSIVTCAIGDTSVELANPLGSTSVLVEPFNQCASGEPKAITSMQVTASTITLNFTALAEATDFFCRVERLS